jgi:hypothetical protein
VSPSPVENYYKSAKPKMNGTMSTICTAYLSTLVESGEIECLLNSAIATDSWLGCVPVTTVGAGRVSPLEYIHGVVIECCLLTSFRRY